jgi:hypothetical protein
MIKYPITDECPNPLAPYDPSKIPGNCADTGDCNNSLTMGPALWVMCTVETGRGGMTYHYTGMECPKGHEENDPATNGGE